MKISVRALLKETFGCFLHHWFMAIMCWGMNLFGGISIILACLTVYPRAAKLIQHLQTEYPLTASLIEKIRGGPLDSTRLMVTAILACLISFWVVIAFLVRANSTIYNETITLKKLLVTALKVTPQFLLVSLVQVLPVVAGCGYILYSMPLTGISGFIMIFLVVISLAALLPVLLIRWALVNAVIINEQRSGLAALRRSWQLTKGQWYPALGGIFLPIFLVSKWGNYFFSQVYALYLYQRLTALPTAELQQSLRVENSHH